MGWFVWTSARDIFWKRRKRLSGCGDIAVANLELSMNALAVLNLMPRLIKIRLSSYLVLFRKVLRDTSRNVFGRQECVVGREIYYDFILFLFYSSSRSGQRSSRVAAHFITSRDEEKSE